MSNRPLTIKQEAFCQAYMRLGDKSAAYREVYSCSKMKPESVNRKAVEVAQNGNVTARIKQLQQDAIERNKASLDEVLIVLADIIRFDPAEMYDEDGNLLPIHKMPKKVRMCIQSFEVEEALPSMGVGDEGISLGNEKNDLYNSVKSTWKLNRMDSKLQEALKKKKSELESCIIFHIEDVPTDKTCITKLFTTQKKRIKSTVKTNKEGRMYPIFDQYGNMEMFVWRFTTKSESQSEIDNIWIYTDRERIDLDNSINNVYSITSRKQHGFDRIPIMYLQQDLPEWEDVKTIIDRFEVALSKLGGSNDYAGYPLLKLYGELVSMPDRNDDGKTLRFPMKEVDDASGKTIHGDAEFLTANNAAETVKLELEKLYSLIHAMSSSPDIAFENLKGLGAMSGVALKLMFLDAIIKAKMNEGENRTMVERCLNIIASGIKNTVETKLSKQSLLVSVQFNSILPSDLKEAVEIATSAVNGGVMSKETAVDLLDMVEDKEKELERINKSSMIKKTIKPAD